METPSCFIDFNLSANSPAIEDAVVVILDLIKETGAVKRWHPRHTDHLRVIILNLLKAYQMSGDGYISYSRMKGVYARMKASAMRYLPFPVAYQAMVTLVDALHSPELSLVDHNNGFYFPEQGNSKPSRMRATQKLIDLFAEYGVLQSTVNRDPSSETIILKDDEKKLIDYDDTATTILMRDNLKSINDLLAQNFIGLCVADKVYDQIVRRIYDIPDSEWDTECLRTMDLTRNRVNRVFNNGSFKQGGRFYSGWWQSIPKEYRRYIRINNLGTVELDFPGLHINLLYALEEKPLPKEDPYLVEGLPKEARTFLKVALNILINAESWQKGIKALRDKFPRHKLPVQIRDFDYKSIVDLFLAKHPPLEKYFGSGAGVHLQYLDSQIAEKAMLILAKKGIPALPMHDSFIVTRRHRQDLEKAMNDAIQDLAGIRLNLKASPTAYEDVYLHGVEEEVQSIENYESEEWTSRKHCRRYYEAWDKWNEGE